MAAHVLIDDGHVRGDRTRASGCAVCGLSAALCARHPACLGERVRVDPGSGNFAKTRARARRRSKAARRTRR